MLIVRKFLLMKFMLFFIILLQSNGLFSQEIKGSAKDVTIVGLLNNSKNVRDFDRKYTILVEKHNFIKNDSLKNELKKVKIDFYQRNFKFREVRPLILDLINDKSKYFNTVGLSRHALDLLNSLNTQYALNYLLKAKGIATEINNKNELSVIYNILGNLYVVNKKYNTAISYYKKSLAINQDDVYQMGLTLNNLSLISYEIQDYEQSKIYHQQLFEVVENNSFEVLKFMYYINEVILERKNNKIKAEQALDIAKKIVSETNNSFYWATYYSGKALLQFQQGEQKDALKSIELSISYYNDENALYYVKEALEIKKEILKKNKNYKELSELYEYISNIESIIKSNFINVAIQEAQVMTLNYKVSEEKILLESKNKSQRILIILSVFIILIIGLFCVNLYKELRTERSNKRHRLALNKLKTFERISDAERKEQDRIGKELHDIIGAQLMLLKMNISQFEHSKEAENQIDLISDQLRLISHNLILKDYSSGNVRLILEDFFHSITQYSDVSIEYFIEEMGKKDDKLVVKFLCRTVQELVHNAIRHGKAKNIIVNFYNETDKIRLIVEDDGIGFENQIKEHEGIGLNNISELVTIAKGEMNIESELGIGTTIAIIFPKLKLKNHA